LLSEEVKDPGLYYMTDEGGGPTKYEIKIVNNEVLVYPIHLRDRDNREHKFWEIDCFPTSNWEKIKE